MNEAQIRVGIGGWNYAPWRGTFYPDKLPQKRELEYASQALSAIEINATFYGRQSPKSWKTWADTAPDGFQFAIKASRYCVSRSKLADSADSIANFFGQGFETLGEKLGPILWQLAPRKTFDPDDIAAFIDLIPQELGGLKLRHAFEPRHASFDDERFFDLCRARNIAVVLEDSDDYPTIDADTAAFRYARLQRMSEDIATGYADSALEGFAKQAAGWRAAGRDTYIFFINGAKVRAPAAALALRQLLSV
jgi:uncharacterized protein YecE (DUF72 family)